MRHLKRVLQGALCCAVLALGAWSTLFVPDQLVVNPVTIPLQGWPPALAGLRVVALADLHAGAPFVDPPKLRRIVGGVNALQPDLVVLLGDYVIHGVLGGRFVAPEVTARELGELRARWGVVAVLGNHDWWLDGPRVQRALEQAGIKVLEDEVVRVGGDGESLWLAGFKDPWGRWPDIPGTLQKVPRGETVVALAHNPDLFPLLPASVSLLLAGHTHGGQVRLPLLGSPIVPSRYGQRYAIGHIEEKGRQLFVSPGIGTSILPIRFGVPPEISLLTLRAKEP